MVHCDGHQENLNHCDHLSIPPDFRIHLTGRDEHIFFDISQIRNLIDAKSPIPITHLFSFIGLPNWRSATLVKAGKRKIWNEAALVSPTKDHPFTENTRLGIDFYLHSAPLVASEILGSPPIFPGVVTRLACDRPGAIFGPFSYSAVQRRNAPPREDMKFSIRMFYTEYGGIPSASYVFSPLSISLRRPKNPT